MEDMPNWIIGLIFVIVGLSYWLTRFHEEENIDGIKYRVTKIPFNYTGVNMTIWKKRI